MQWIIPVFLVATLGPSPDELHTIYGKTIAGWRAVLRDPASSDSDRARAAGALGFFGKEAGPAAPDLIAMVRKGGRRDEAIEALVRIGAGDEATVPPLIEQFHKRGCLHLTATGSIGYFTRVQDMLVKVGAPAAPALLRILTGRDKSMRVCAAEALGEIGPGARAAVPALLRAIEHPEDGQDAYALAHHAVIALGRIGPDARDAIPALTRLLDAEGDDHFDVVMALAGIGAPPIRNRLDAFLKRGDISAVDELAYLGPKAREAIPPLREALADKRLEIRLFAAIAIARIDPSVAEAIPVLIEGLSHFEDESLDVRIRDVPQSLGRFGPRAEAALPGLIDLARKGHIGNEMLKALTQIDPRGRRCVPALVEALKNEDYQTVEVAAQYLGTLGPAARDAIPALVVAMTRDFERGFANGFQPQAAAAKALRRIDPEAKSTIPALIAALKYRHRAPFIPGEPAETDSGAAEAAAQALGDYGPKAKAAVPALIEAVRLVEKDDDGWPVRQAAILALGRIGPDAQAAIPTLRKCLDEERDDPSYRTAILIALAALSPEGREAAERWLTGRATPTPPGRGRGFEGSPEERARLLGVLGRTSFEADRYTQLAIEWIDSSLAHVDPREDDSAMTLEWQFEKLARLGVAGRLAIPRLNEFLKHPDPPVRTGAEEAIERIALSP